jgi:hypothetical protein
MRKTGGHHLNLHLAGERQPRYYERAGDNCFGGRTSRTAFNVNVDRCGLPDVNSPSATIIPKKRCIRDKADGRWGFRITKFRVKLVHESSAVVHDLSATITASKSWIAWEHSLRFKCSPTPMIRVNTQKDVLAG